MKDYVIFLIIIQLPQGTFINFFGFGFRPILKDTVLITENTTLILILI